MDERSLEKISRKRERGYIWLERELKIELGISTAVIAVFFFILFYFQVPAGVWAALFFASELLNGIWCFLRYRREYRNYLSILEYLEEFEQGNYGYQKSREGLDTGIRAQLTEQLERMGQALGTMKGRLVEEKENTRQKTGNNPRFLFAVFHYKHLNSCFPVYKSGFYAVIRFKTVAHSLFKYFRRKVFALG